MGEAGSEPGSEGVGGMAERTLRERCIEAGTEALAKRFFPGVHWSTDRDFVTAVIRTDSAAVLDAVLGVLTEHANEMVPAAMKAQRRVDDAIVDGYPYIGEFESVEAAVLGALAVLGGDE